MFKSPPRARLRLARARRATRTRSSSSSTRRPASASSSKRATPAKAHGAPIHLDMEFARGGRRGRHALRGAAPRGDGRAAGALHTPGRRRRGVADHAAARRRTPAGAHVRAGFVGPGRWRRRSVRARSLARTLDRGVDLTPAPVGRGRQVDGADPRRSERPFEVLHRRADAGGQHRERLRHLRIVATARGTPCRIEACTVTPCREVRFRSSSEHARHAGTGEVEQIRRPTREHDRRAQTVLLRGVVPRRLDVSHRWTRSMG